MSQYDYFGEDPDAIHSRKEYRSSNRDYSQLEWLVGADAVAPFKRKEPAPRSLSRRPREQEAPFKRNVRTLRNWNLGIPGGTEDECEGEDNSEESLGIPEWASRSYYDEKSSPTDNYKAEAKAEDNWYTQYHSPKGRGTPALGFEPIGLGPNDLSYTIPGFDAIQPLRQDGTLAEPEKDDRFYGPDWRRKYFQNVDRIEEDPRYIFLQKLAGATNTTVENLLVVKDLETRALRAHSILDAQRADTRIRFEKITQARTLLRTGLEALTAERAKLETNTLAGAEASRARSLVRNLQNSKHSYERAVKKEQMSRHDTLINDQFVLWMDRDMVEDLSREDIKEAMDERLESLLKGFDTPGVSPGLRELETLGPEFSIKADGIRTQATALDVVKGMADRKSDLVFLGLWIFYENREAIRILADARAVDFDRKPQDILGMLSRRNGLPEELVDGRFDFPLSVIDFSTLENISMDKIRIYAQKEIESFYDDTGAGKTVGRILAEKKAAATTALEQQRSTLIEDGVQAMRFISILAEFSITNFSSAKFDVVTFQSATIEVKLLEINRILEALRQMVSKTGEHTKDILNRIRTQEVAIERTRFKIDLLLTPMAAEEPEIPYRAQGEWVFDPVNTGRIPLAPIVVYAIEQAYQLVADNVSALGAHNPSSESDIKQAIETLQTDPRYRSYFVEIVARKMGESRGTFSVRWMPDLAGSHKSVIRYNINKLRAVASGSIDRHFRAVLGAM